MASQIPAQRQQEASDIQALKGLEAVRKRPGMYVGGTDIHALHHLVYEVVDNAIDEAMAGRCDFIEVIIHADSSITVTDNGGGIPVEMHPTENISTLELVLATLHAGGKFGGGAYKVSGGLHGVGVKAVNALSSWMIAEVRRDGYVWKQTYERGVRTSDVEPIRELEPGEPTGTHITFMPDEEIFTGVRQEFDFSFKTLMDRFREMAYVTRGVTIRLVDERETPIPRECTFYFEGGLKSFVRYLNRNRDAIHDVVSGSGEGKFTYVQEGQELEGTMEVDFAFQYTDGTNTTELTFANTINTPDGGTHQTGLRTALTRVINNYARKAGILKDKDANFTGRHTLEGLTAIVSIKHPNPQFESQTKVKLMNPEVNSGVATVVSDVFSEYLEVNPKEARRIVEKCLSAMRIQDALDKQRELLLNDRKSFLTNTTLPGKLADCSDRGPHTELYVVEGDSAGGCLVADTRVVLASGLTKTMKELAEDWACGIQHFGYATNADGDVRIVPLIEPRLTKRQAAVVEVVLDNGERIQCTPDHPFRLRDGSYKAAADLEPGESLMPLKTRLTDTNELPGPGYEMVWMNGQARWNHTHHLADLYNLLTGIYNRKAGNTRHHKDFNKLNNDPRNIERMPWRVHQQLHAELAGEMSKRLWQDPAYRERKIQQLSQQAILQWQDPAYRQYMSERVKIQRQNDVLNQKLLQGFQDWFASLNSDEYQAYCERMREMQESYWSSEEHRRAQSERTTRFFEDHPEAREERRDAALRQWEDAELRAWRAEKTREQWRDEAYRRNHSLKVSEWWKEHPEHRDKIVAALKRGWADAQQREHILSALAKWREATSPEERGKHIREGHRLKALLLLNQVLDADDKRQAYEHLRLQTARTALSYDRLVEEHFGGDEQRMTEAAANVNCKVVAVHPLNMPADVYDLTVDSYHNFALASGVFVHNSAKQGRDRHFQAILPLRGKILNTERATLNKILDSNEIKTLVSALGVGIREDFNLEKLRYGRVIIMSVAGDESTLVMDEAGRTEFVKIGDFIDDCMEGRRNPDRYQVMSFDLNTHETRFRPLKAVIRHAHEEPMYRLRTRYNRSVKVTSSHSVFVLENGQVRLKKGNEIRPGDLLVASRRLPRPATSPVFVDLLLTFYQAGLTNGLYLKGEGVRRIAAQRVMAKTARPELWSEPRVTMPAERWQQLAAHRQSAGVSQMQVASAVGVKQPITISHWERGVNRPILPHFTGYLKAIGWDRDVDYALIPSKLDERLAQDDASKNARWREVSNYKPFKDFTAAEISQLGMGVQIVPQAHGERAFERYLPVSRELLWFLGWFVAEGTLSAHQVSLNLGTKDGRFLDELSAAIESVFGEVPRRYDDPDSQGIKLYFHSVAAARLLKAWGLDRRAHEKKLPDIVFSLPESLQLAFLEGYFLGDGTTGGKNISFTTNSAALKEGLLYLLGQLGLIASTSEFEPSTLPGASIQTRRPYFNISIAGKDQLVQCRTVWQRHANAYLLDEHLARPGRKALDFVPIGDDLMGLEVLSAEVIEPVGQYVYDFSVQDDENFICGTGGLCAHNTDADVDGAHIRTLLLTFFFRYMTALIQNGHLFIAQPPIFRLEWKKQVEYVYPESNLKEDQLLAKYLARYPEPTKVSVQRYKGLGEMNPEQLWETTMNPARRTLLKVTYEDAAEADRTFDMLMGPSVPPRRKFIQTHARNATLDV